MANLPIMFARNWTISRQIRDGCKLRVRDFFFKLSKTFDFNNWEGRKKAFHHALWNVELEGGILSEKSVYICFYLCHGELSDS